MARVDSKKLRPSVPATASTGSSATKAPRSGAPRAPARRSSTYDAVKPKPVSMSGRHRAHDAGHAPRPDLAAEVQAVRTATSAGSSEAGLGRLGARRRSSVATTTGPITAAQWSSPREIVGRLTQNPAGEAGGVNASERCGPANLLAASLMNGPGAAATTLRGAANSTQLSAAERTSLRGIADRVEARTATFEDLSHAQALMYRAGNNERMANSVFSEVNTALVAAGQRAEAAGDTAGLAQVQADSNLLQRTLPIVDAGGSLSEADRSATQAALQRYGAPGVLTRVTDPQNSARNDWVLRGGPRTDDSGFSDRELESLARTSTGWAQARNMDTLSTDRPLRTLLGDPPNGLANGQAATMRVAGSRGDADPNHFITIGRQPDGTPYLYNPDPARGDHVLVWGDADVQRALARYDTSRGRVRADGDGDRPNVVITQPHAPEPHAPAPD